MAASESWKRWAYGFGYTQGRGSPARSCHRRCVLGRRHLAEIIVQSLRQARLLGALAPALAQIAGFAGRQARAASQDLCGTGLSGRLGFDVYRFCQRHHRYIGCRVLAPVFSDAGLPLPGILAWFSWVEDNIGMLSLLGILALALLAVLFRFLGRNPTASVADCDRAFFARSP